MKQTFKVYLSKILLRNKQLELAGIGVLRLATLPASISHDNLVIFPPRDQVYLVPRDQQEHDQVLLRVMQLVENYDVASAKSDLDLFMEEVHAGLKLRGEAALPGLGKLVTSEFGEPYFLPNVESQGLNTYFGLPELRLPRYIPTRKASAVDRSPTTTQQQHKRPSAAWGFIMGLAAILLIMVSILIFRTWNDTSPTTAERSVTVSSNEEKRLNVAPQVNEEPSNLVEDIPEVVTQPITKVPRVAIVVGAFGKQVNVDRMVKRLQEEGLEPYQMTGQQLTTVGFVCDSNTVADRLSWAKKAITPEAWVHYLSDK